MRSNVAYDALAARSVDRRWFLKSTLAGAGSLWLASPFSQWAFGQDANQSDPLIRHQQDPLNAEPRLGLLPESFLTPTKHFYIRNHGNIPSLEEQSFRLKIDGLVEATQEFTLAELREKFPKVETVATMTCAGNRRREHNAFQKVSGVQWDAGAIGNATWEGVRLSDVLKSLRLKEGAAHVWFEGADEIALPDGKTNFGASIPIEKAMGDDAANPGAMLAWGMNGEALTAEHGYPLRTVVPGYIGARSVKWLNRIVVSDRPSPNHYVKSAYKVVTEDSAVMQAEQNPIYRFPINVAICDPAPEATVQGTAKVRGYALPTGLAESRVRRVEVSANGGRRWVEAKLLDEHVPYTWTRWEAEVPLTDRSTRLIARATDSAGGQTPDRVTWNRHGYLYNGWHPVPIKVES